MTFAHKSVLKVGVVKSNVGYNHWGLPTFLLNVGDLVLVHVKRQTNGFLTVYDEIDVQADFMIGAWGVPEHLIEIIGDL